MKFFCISIFLLLLTSNHLVAEDQDLKSLVQQLGAESYQDRENASQKLWEQGKASLDELRKALKSSDPEIQDRAKALINKIELGITPDTPKELIETLQKFYEGDDQQKGQMLIELTREEGGWLTIRTLLYKDFNQELADIIMPQVDSNVVLTLRDAGRHKDAGAIFELAVIFSDQPDWINNLAAFVDERSSQNDLLDRFTALEKLVPSEKFKILAAIYHTKSVVYRSLGKFEEAATESQKLYKIAFQEDSDTLKALSKPIFVDSHLLAGKYAYLEQFWEKTSLDIPQKNRLWNILWLQKIQDKLGKYEETKQEIFKLMDNKNDYITLTTVLLLSSDVEAAESLLKKHEDYQALADLSRGKLDYLSFEKWLERAAEKDEDSKLELLAFRIKNKKEKIDKKQFIDVIEAREDKSQKLTAIVYLAEAGFKKDAQKYLEAYMTDLTLSDNDALRAAWALTESRNLAELYMVLRDKSKAKNPKDAIELINLLSLTDDSDSFVEYVKMLEEKFEGYSRDMRQITSILGNYCLDKEWYASAAAIMAFLEPAQRGLFNSLMESEARIRNKEYTKAVHNLLGPVGTPKISLPYYLVAQAYTLNKEMEKQQKALEFARSYDMGRENVISMTSQYLYENGHYEFFLETAEKLCRVGGSMSAFRVRSYQKLSSSHIHNLEHEKAKPFFMAYYKLASSDLSLIQGGLGEAMRLGYQFNEYKLREATKKKDSDAMEHYAQVCDSLFLNNIEVPILLRESNDATAKDLYKKYFNKQWQHMLKSIKELPHNAILLNSVAWLGALNEHELDACLKMVNKAIDLEPSAANFDTRAEVQYRLKLYKEALESIEKAASLDKLEPFFRDRVKKFRKAVESN
ncbi:MAG: hypothetical protein NE334_05425 [Lentisphaeraceae bacterium]|nr:hypothetical protein [Lentisphaeraceae bacterium]